jgi:hypothetical protein
MLIKSKSETLPYSDQILIEQIIAGCEQFVENMEAQWYGRRVRHPKISDRQLVQLAALFPSISQSKSTDDGFRPFPEIRSRLSDVKSVDPAVVNRSLKTLVNVGYYQKSDSVEPSESSGPNVTYHKTKIRSELEELASRSEPRTIVYNKLLESGVLERYLRVCRYCDLLMNKHVDVESIPALQGRRVKVLLKNKQTKRNTSSVRKFYKTRVIKKFFWLPANWLEWTHRASQLKILHTLNFLLLVEFHTGKLKTHLMKND